MPITVQGNIRKITTVKQLILVKEESGEQWKLKENQNTKSSMSLILSQLEIILNGRWQDYAVMTIVMFSKTSAR